MHSPAMEGHVLLKLLLQKHGIAPNALADTLHKRTLQSQMQRYLNGNTKSPRPATLEPIAKFFGIGVEAFYQPEIAQRLALELGLIHAPQNGAPRIEQTQARYALTAPPTPIRPRQQLSVSELITQLGRALEPYDATARRAVAALLHDLALHPESADVAGQRVAALLNVPGNELPPRSSNSR